MNHLCTSRAFLILICVFLGLSPKSQTVGVIEYTENLSPGYTIFSPLTNSNTFLIDECGQVINEWNNNGIPGMMAKLDTDGNIIKGIRSGSPFFSGGGIGGILSKFNWENEIIFSYELMSSSFHKHHDFEILPNGNILVLGWGSITSQEAEAQGRISTAPDGMYTERIIEIKPINEDSFDIVWEWDVYDHLVQNIDESLPNYGDPLNFPERIDINYTNGISLNVEDWLHCNSIDYNPQLDQIILNCRNFAEFWIIDHSTTTEEAESSEGGNAGMGGDIIYRWGNPEAYGAGPASEQSFFGQHDAHWIKEGIPGAGNIRIFNNGAGRPDGNYSTIDEIIPPLDGFNYTIEGDKYGPQDLEVIYGGPTGEQSFFSQRISGSQKLPNGNTLICNGNNGKFIEVNEGKTIDWFYVNPSGSFVSQQGSPPQTASNSVFQLIKYQPDFPGFDDKDLTPGEKIEIDPIDNCQIINSIENGQINYDIDAFHDMANSALHVKNNNNKNLELHINNYQGNFVEKVYISDYEELYYNTYNLPSSLYVATIYADYQLVKQFKFAIIND